MQDSPADPIGSGHCPRTAQPVGLRPGLLENAAYAYFIIWRYAAVLAIPGMHINSVTVATTSTVTCGYQSGATACTTVFDDITIGTDPFTDTGNSAASTVGHEFRHTAGALNSGECAAYTWEVDSQTGTGMNSNDNAPWLAKIGCRTARRGAIRITSRARNPRSIPPSCT